MTVFLKLALVFALLQGVLADPKWCWLYWRPRKYDKCQWRCQRNGQHHIRVYQPGHDQHSNNHCHGDFHCELGWTCFNQSCDEESTACRKFLEHHHDPDDDPYWYHGRHNDDDDEEVTFEENETEVLRGDDDDPE